MSLTTEQIAELERVAGMSADGRLYPKQVVDSARDPDNVLHSKFEWNDRVAADAYRLEQARQLIEVFVKDVPGIGECRAYISVAKDRPGYQRVEDALVSDVTRDLLVAQLKSDLRSTLKRYSYLRALAPTIFESVETVLVGSKEEVAA